VKKTLIIILTLFATAAMAQDLPKIAVYVTGDVNNNEKKALGTRMLATLVNSGRYKGIERSNSFLAEIEKEQLRQRSGAIDDSQISELGRQFGIKFICIADITPAFGEFQVSARIVNVETAEVEFIGDAASPLKTMNDLALVSAEVVRNMFGEQTTAQPTPAPAPTPEPVTQETAQEPLPAATSQTKTTEPKPKPHKKETKQKKWLSVGGGGFFASDFGGDGFSGGYVGHKIGISYTSQLMGGGVNLFLDVIYAEIGLGLTFAGGDTRMALKGGGVSLRGLEKNVPTTYLNITLLGKYPFAVGNNSALYPAIGIDYALCLAALSYGFDDDEDKELATGYDSESPNDMSQFWIKFGIGYDQGFTDRVFLRTQALYGIAFASKYSSDMVKMYGGKTNLSHGLTIKAGVGFRL